MSLQKQLVHLSLTGGVQTKDDPFLVIPSKLAVADNVEFDDKSTVKTRGGQASVSLTPTGVWNLPAFTPGIPKRLFTHNGVPLLDHSKGVSKVSALGGTAPVYNAAPVGMNPALNLARAAATTQRMASVDPKDASPGSGLPWFSGNFDMAVSGNTACYAVESRMLDGSLRSSIKVVLIDTTTGFRTLEYMLVDGTYTLTKPRVVATSSKFYVYFACVQLGVAQYQLRCVTLTQAGDLSPVNPVAVYSTDGNAEASANGYVLYDVAVPADESYVAAAALSYTGVGYELEVSQLDLDGYSILDGNTLSTSSRPVSLTVLATKNGSSQNIIHCFYGTAATATTAKAHSLNLTLGTASGETVVGTGSGGTTVARIAAYEASSSLIYLAYDSVTTLASGVYSSQLRVSSFTHAYGSITQGIGASPWFIGGRIASVAGRLYLPMVFISNNNYQSTNYLVDLTSVLTNLGASGTSAPGYHVVARIDYGEVASTFDLWKSYFRVPSTPVLGSAALLPYLKYETDTRLAGTTNETAIALASATVDFDSQLGHVEINGITLLAGACPYVFDGNNYVEESFHHAPEIISASVGGGGTFQLAGVGTYTLVATMVWQDAAGNWHESAPSNQISVTTTALGQYVTPLVTTPPTQKRNARVVYYRTQASSTDTTLYLAIDKYERGVTSDTALAAGEALYTTGGVLPNEPMPSCRDVTVFQGRVVGTGTQDGSGVTWSKVTEKGYCVEFCSSDPLHRLTVPVVVGRAVASEEMDDRLFIICERGAGVIAGTGPAATGTQGQYSDFSTVVTETGCDWNSPKSVVRGPEGIWFRSPFGLRLISRSGTLARGQDGKQAGSEVDGLVSGNLVAVAGDTRQQIRFYQSSGTVLVWDYQWLQWTRFTGTANVDAVFANDRFYHVSANGSASLLRYTSDTVTTDVSDAGVSGTSITSTIETPWLSFAGIQGYQRVYRLLILGSEVYGAGPVSFTLSAGYDFQPVATVGTGSQTPANARLQIQHHLVQQKCESLKLRFAFVQGTATPVRIRLTDLTLQVGVKTGYNKMPSSQRF